MKHKLELELSTKELIVLAHCFHHGIDKSGFSMHNQHEALLTIMKQILPHLNAADKELDMQSQLPQDCDTTLNSLKGIIADFRVTHEAVRGIDVILGKSIDVPF